MMPVLSHTERSAHFMTMNMQMGSKKVSGFPYYSFSEVYGLQYGNQNFSNNNLAN
jgi:hypothetical protein